MNCGSSSIWWNLTPSPDSSLNIISGNTSHGNSRNGRKAVTGNRPTRSDDGRVERKIDHDTSKLSEGICGIAENDWPDGLDNLVVSGFNSCVLRKEIFTITKG
jgi:hypothetical protein